MKLLNLGCGQHYSENIEWKNIDFVSCSDKVLEFNLLKGIPLEDSSIDLVYHSHVLEHFSKKDGEKFIEECFRVLKKGGILRIAIPDLEQIAKKYLEYLELGLNQPENKLIRANYEWMKLEMYDQTVRNFSGGDMANYLFQPTILNEEFVFERIGEEGRALRKRVVEYQRNNSNSEQTSVLSWKQKIKNGIKQRVLNRLNIQEESHTIGAFRLGGEIHQWMYDRYSLFYLLKQKGGIELEVKSAFESKLGNWSDFELDGRDGKVRKPDSIFIECIKG
jgi:predicted SAM-dependent methyltransferase